MVPDRSQEQSSDAVGLRGRMRVYLVISVFFVLSACAELFILKDL